MDAHEISSALGIEPKVASILTLNGMRELEPSITPLETTPSPWPSTLILKDDLSNELELRRKFGRWLPQDRYSLDQVPCNLVEGDRHTYHFRGDERVWIASWTNTNASARFS